MGHSKRVLGGRVTINIPATTSTKVPVAALVDGNRAAVAGIYTDKECLTAYSTGAVKGGHLFFKLASQRTFNSDALVMAWDTADEAEPNLTPMSVVGSSILSTKVQVNLTAAYTNAAFTTAYVGATAARKTAEKLYLKLASGSTNINVGDEITTYDASHPLVRTRMHVLAKESLAGPVDGLTVQLLNDDVTPFVNAADSVYRYQGGSGGVTVVETVLLADDAAPMLDGADYLYQSDTVFNGSLIHAWCHSGEAVTELGLFQKLGTGVYSPDLLGAEAAWGTLEAGNMSPTTPRFLVEAELYVDSNTTDGAVLELIIDPWVMGHGL